MSLLRNIVGKFDRRFLGGVLHHVYYSLLDIRGTARRFDERFLGGAARWVHYHLSDMLWLARWNLGGRPFRLGRIDWAALAPLVPETLHREVSWRLRGALGPSDNIKYFQNLKIYGASHLALHGVSSPFELFPPNVAALDFLVKLGPRREEQVVLDFGTGMGNLIVYLRRLGFQHVHGYDNHSQISRETSEAFLREFGLNGVLVAKEQLGSLGASIVIVGSLPWSYYGSDIQPVLSHPSLKYALLDAYYPCPERLPGFRRVCEYRRLLRVFEKI